MNNLVKHLPSISDIDDALAMIESFELQDIKKAIGDESFFVLMDVLKSMESHHDMIMMLGAMDRLLSTDRNDLIEYRDDFSNLRVYSSKEEKGQVGDEMISEILQSNIQYLVEELPIISEYVVVVNTLALLNISYLSLNTPEDNYSDIIINSLTEDSKDIHEIIEGKDITKIITSFYKLEEILTSEQDNSNGRVVAFFTEREIDAYGFEDIKELVEILVSLSED